MREAIKNSKRIIIKIGTSSLTHENGEVNLRKLEHIAKVLTNLCHQDKEIILVSSGAIGAGSKRLGLKTRPVELEMKQATASVGQTILMNMYQKFFGEYNQPIGQVLLTKDIITDEIKSYNTKNTLETLIKLKVIPIINENDCISTAEIEGFRFGDNDTLSATVAQLINADVLILLTDIDGLYTDNPKNNPNAQLINCIPKITPEIEALAQDTNSEFGTGGMITKLKAAKLATTNGVHTIIASGDNINILYNILEGQQLGTWFCPLQNIKRRI